MDDWKTVVDGIVSCKISGKVTEESLTEAETEQLVSIFESLTSYSEMSEYLNKQPIHCCLMLEAYASLANFHGNNLFLQLITRLIDSLELPKVEFKWFKGEEDGFQRSLRVQAFHKIRTLNAILQKSELSILNIEAVQLANNASCYYGGDSLPWSDNKVSSMVEQLIDNIMKKEPNLVDNMIISFEPLLKQIAKINEANSKITQRGYKRRNNYGELFKGISPLLGGSFSKQLNEYDQFKLEFIGKVSNLKLIIHKLSLHKIEDNWRSILPLMLQFLDDSDLMVKTQAIEILDMILVKIEESSNESKNIIKRTEVANILYDAMVPCLLALPSLTPTEKSLLILPTAYRTVIKLFKVSSMDYESYCMRLSGVINDFMMPSFVKVKDIPQILLILFNVLQVDVIENGDLGKYLIVISNKLTYTLLDVLMEPFIVYSAEVVNKGVHVLELLIKKLPAITKYKYDILACLLTLLKRFDKYEVRNIQPTRETIQNIVRRDLNLTSVERSKLDDMNV